MKSVILAATGVLLTVALASPVTATPKKPIVKKPTAKKPVAKPTVGTLGAAQMKGGDGVFGQTYTLKDGPNITLLSAEYSIERLPMEPEEAFVPKANEKLLILHLKVQNPRTNDMYLGRNFVTFSTVAADGQTRDGIGDTRLINQQVLMGNTLKPGQNLPAEVITACVVPANGPVPKLILNAGREGTSEQVIRYFLGQGKNTIKPLPAPYADPTDPSGATALAEFPGELGKTYVCGTYDLTVNSIGYAPGPFGDTAAEDGKRFLVVNVTATNKTWRQNYFKDSVAGTLFTDDDEKTTDFIMLKGKRDEVWDGRQIDPAESFTIRMVYQVPNDAKGKTFKLAEVEDNTDNRSHAIVFDLSNVK